MKGRTIAIGDVHGCYEEFDALLERLSLQPNDRVIQIGDLVNKGPDSHKAVKLARKRKLEAVIGNHELRLLTGRLTGSRRHFKSYDEATFERLTAADWDYISKLPERIYDARLNTVFVHAGFLPQVNWRDQTASTMTSIQVIDESGQPAKRSQVPAARSWAEAWSGNPFVVYGHTARPEVFMRNGSVGIDTGCVYGGHLTAYILEERAFVQVRAKAKYADSRYFDLATT